jgi:transposase
MRGSDTVCGALFSYVDLEKGVRPGHPLRVIREIANDALASLSAEFDRLYAPDGRESIPSERLLRAFLLQAFYSIRSERQLVERIEFDLLFRWLVGLGVDDQVEPRAIVTTRSKALSLAKVRLPDTRSSTTTDT